MNGALDAAEDRGTMTSRGGWAGWRRQRRRDQYAGRRR